MSRLIFSDAGNKHEASDCVPIWRVAELIKRAAATLKRSSIKVHTFCLRRIVFGRSRAIVRTKDSRSGCAKIISVDKNSKLATQADC